MDTNNFKQHVPFLDGPENKRVDPVVNGAKELRSSSLTPTRDMWEAKGRLEMVAKPPLKDTKLLACHGWLAPDGTLYSCGYKNHDPLCRALGYEHESDIEDAGFCKLSNLEWLVSSRFCTRELTEEQWTTIENWYSQNGFPEAHFMRLVTGL